MSLLFHPYDVSFMIIDFKGGGMVNQFRDLPHLAGAITNIDGKAVNRSLLSIRAELKKRQELFASCGVNHIDAYIRLYKQGIAKVPLPHLILDRRRVRRAESGTAGVYERADQYGPYRPEPRRASDPRHTEAQRCRGPADLVELPV